MTKLHRLHFKVMVHHYTKFETVSLRELLWMTFWDPSHKLKLRENQGNHLTMTKMQRLHSRVMMHQCAKFAEISSSHSPEITPDGQTNKQTDGIIKPMPKASYCRGMKIAIRFYPYHTSKPLPRNDSFHLEVLA